MTDAGGRPGGGPPIRLIVADIDGTLIGRDNHVIAPRVQGALAAARAMGVHVALCTGRPMSSLRLVADALGLPGPDVAFDGALVASPGAAPIYRLPLPEGAARRLVDAARAFHLVVELYTAEAHYIDAPSPLAQAHADLIRVAQTVRSLDDVIASAGPGGIVKGQLIADGEADRERVRALESMGLGVRFGWATPPPGHRPLDYVNITHPDVNKGTAVNALADHLGVPLAATMALGDGPNDAPLLRVAGLAVAMGNAAAALKEIADVVAPSVDEDGAAVVIEQYVLGSTSMSPATPERGDSEALRER